VQFPIGAVLQHSNTPSLRVAGFEDEDEDDDEDENEAPHERPRCWAGASVLVQSRIAIFARVTEATHQAQTDPSAATFRAAHLLASPRAEALGYGV
jgi:hypothetical protein